MGENASLQRSIRSPGGKLVIDPDDEAERTFWADSGIEDFFAIDQEIHAVGAALYLVFVPLGNIHIQAFGILADNFSETCA